MSQRRYHINPETGKVGQCLAKRRCRFGDNSVHYPSEKDALMTYERQMARESDKTKQVKPGVIKALPSDLIVSPRQMIITPDEYFIGDPYLTVATRDQEGWNGIIASIDDQFGWENDVVDPDKEITLAVGALYNEKPILAFKGMQGEGLYWSIAPTYRLPSETGLIGAVPLSTLKELGYDADLAEKQSLGMKFTVEEATNMWRDEYGIIVIGGQRLICHNDLIFGNFKQLDRLDGINKQLPTNETYHKLQQQGHKWLTEPELFHL